ncbi:GNAT family N-acetyltransferase [Marinactinospora rubrisoli]|uniref:GNAT family N-acetyltransferase n=1 Tax=Marinactinospora rubrisoli TaxID=2715399 RepID=A0ABW2KGP4_9ACTN
MTSNTAYAPVWRAGDADQRTVVDVLTQAFTDDPVARWLFPDGSGDLQARFYRSLITHPAGESYLAGRAEGAAVWLALGAGQPPHEDPPGGPGTGGTPPSGAGGARLSALGRALAERHPISEPHLYLSCVGVARELRGTGLGSALLRHRLERADADRVPAYLEASSPRSRALYLRHGFEDLGEPVRVAGGPPLWPMWRRPRG